jgi:branched-subunit amino acid transport protein AzlD
MESLSGARILIFFMGLVIFFCRIFPFLFFRSGNRSPRREALLAFVEKTAPPAAMTVLAFNAIGVPLKENPFQILPVLAASVLTAVLHLWKRNALISIIGGTVLYMILFHILQ